MKKNRLFVLGLVTVFVALVSLTFVSSTWAKYTSNAEGQDTARVAYWGYNQAGDLTIDGLFKDVYDDVVDPTVDSKDSANVIAPGTRNEQSFSFAYANNTNIGAEAPEVAYNFTVSVEGSLIDADIENNPNILWALDDDEYGSWDQLMIDLLELSGTDLDTTEEDEVKAGTLVSVTTEYAPNTMPAAFAQGVTHTIKWKWVFAGNEVGDTAMGNKQTLDDLVIKITITAEQAD